MLKNIIALSLRNKLIVMLFILCWIGYGMYALFRIPIGAVPDITNNQVQVITTTRDMSTPDVERLLTYPVELEMSNLPGVEEIRSVSKFGLSVVTVVFDDDMGTYLPRQLINEKLSQIADKMPLGQQPPFMGPISTGLGEIYQYIVDVEPEYKGKYNVQELRSIQDWIVKRQLAGIPGVIEVNTWGGYLKTYEIAIDPQRLNAQDVTIDELYRAVENNNSIVGGGYIEKSQEAYFIRANGTVKSLSDIENIVVRTVESNPIFIRDIATVQFGSATRFGAITGNGDGEKVMGQVMMLKGANSKRVIDAVEERVAEIQKSLPEGVVINPVLSRTDLINKTTFTIAENLLLGFLIVLFVVVLLLGSWRSGLLVASVIPLTLLFALSMMYIFGVDANLMSLGAIDFGIIIDGAVIIVEYITFLLSRQMLSGSESITDAKDKIILQGTSKMLHSAVFGQLIIIIVFIPILTLTGVEGKMFKPMGLTFCFALIGAMILCFTYVPVMASIFLKAKQQEVPSVLGYKLIDWVKSIYKPLLFRAIKFKNGVLVIVGIIFMIAMALFSSMGGEFVPTLDEGDFVIQPVLKTGMSLAATVAMTTRIEQIVKRFPEVKQVVSRIGAAEVPTDPMSMEESDIIITLFEKDSWQSAKTKDALADTLKEAILREIPNIEVEFTQPIEMRFNELISGARSDLAIKIFGEDLDILYHKALEVESLVHKIDGVADYSVEKIDGLPQMSVNYDREKIARYGLTLKQLNDVIQIGFAGKVAGVFQEGERQYDIVIKYTENNRSDLNHLKEALVSLPNGDQMPLSNFATISYDTGPARISRDNTKRRAIVGVNIRGRDLQSVVDEIKAKVEDQVKLPVGYRIEYGGQFKNLENATKRLMIAVPIALLLIFVMLYFAFGSIRETLLIYTAIPLSAIGGVFALYMRGMPFSISAGVGFIALFGIAVLNGIVLIEHFKELKQKSMDFSNDFIIQAAVDRIRPVLLTALAAALGFLPMAISHSAGAEVQKPLATVVIGGLVSATLLTLIILPILYLKFGQRSLSKFTSVPMVAILVCISLGAWSQQPVTLNDAILMAQNQSFSAQLNNLKLLKEKVKVEAVKETNNYDFFYNHDRNNLNINDVPLHVIGVGHNFLLPAVNHAKYNAQTASLMVSQKQVSIMQYELAGTITRLYEDVQYQYAKLQIIMDMDSVFNEYYRANVRKNELGGSDRLEVYMSAQKVQELALQKAQIAQSIDNGNHYIKMLTQNPSVEVQQSDYTMWTFSDTMLSEHPIISLQDASLMESNANTEVIKATNLPQVQVRLFNGIGSFNRFGLYPGIEVGVSIPFNRKSQDAKLQMQHIEVEMIQIQKESIYTNLHQHKIRINNNLNNLRTAIDQYSASMISTFELKESAAKAFSMGRIDYVNYQLLLNDVLRTRLAYLDLVHDYNQEIISYKYLNL